MSLVTTPRHVTALQRGFALRGQSPVYQLVETIQPVALVEDLTQPDPYSGGDERTYCVGLTQAAGAGRTSHGLQNAAGSLVSCRLLGVWFTCPVFCRFGFILGPNYANPAGGQFGTPIIGNPSPLGIQQGQSAATIQADVATVATQLLNPLGYIVSGAVTYFVDFSKDDASGVIVPPNMLFSLESQAAANAITSQWIWTERALGTG